MNRRTYLLLSVALLVLFISSCTKDIENVNRPENYYPGTFSDVFESFWTGMNNNYVFWDIDTTDWDAMYRRYQPVFAKMNINDTNDIKKSVSYFRLMTQGLVDSHYHLSFTRPSIADSTIDPSYDRKKNTIHPFVFYPRYAIRYLNNDAVYGYDSSTDPSNQHFAMAGTYNNEVLYFYCDEFELKSSYESSVDNDVKKALNYFFARLANPEGLKGVIIDVRGNGGGNVTDLNFLLGRMISSPLTFGYTRYKSGNGRLDYTPWAPAIVTPQTGAQSLNIPVVALADAWSASLAELTTMAIHTLPNGKFVGETTWGANGPLASSNQSFNGGQFFASDFLYAYTSSSEFKYLDGNIYEGKGFPPDIAVPFDEASLRQGRDPALEAALLDILQ